MSQPAEGSSDRPIALTSRVGTPPPSRLRAALARGLFVLVTCGFAVVVKYVYVDVIVADGRFSYMGVRALDVDENALITFFLLAIAPASWLPLHLRRATDIVELFLFCAVHIPTCVLLPFVSYAPLETQLVFASMILLGLWSLTLRYRIPLLRLPTIKLESNLFWACIAIFCFLALMVFANSDYLSLANIDLLDVYGQRLELAERAGEIGGAYFYFANWIGTAIAPFLIIVGMHRRNLLPFASGIIIAFASFVASSNKLNYMVIAAVIAGYVLLRITKGRHFASMLVAGLMGLAATLLIVDAHIGQTTGVELPAATWAVFHRTFTNNGFLSAVYLDLFRMLEPALYADSFLRWVTVSSHPEPFPLLAGASFTDIPGVWANANLWADGFANLGYAGIVFSALSAICVLWVYDSISAHQNQAVAAAALIGPTAVLANTAVHTALVSNGIFLTCLLMMLWRDIDTRSARAQW